ncbi:MAG: hypothetical protein ACREOO_31120 [bacterium]
MTTLEDDHFLHPDVQMKIPPHSSPARRMVFHHAQRRLMRNFFSWFGGRRSSRAAAPESRPRGRSREDQITIEVLRFRLADPQGVTKKDGAITYSAAFRDFIVQRYEPEQHKLTRSEFAHAAEIPFDTLCDWLAAAAQAFEPLAPPGATIISAAAAERLQHELENAQPAPRFSWAMFSGWVRAQFSPEAFTSFYYLTDYGRKELHRVYQENISRGLVIAAVLHVAGIMIYWSTLEQGEDPKTVTIFKYVEIEPKVVPEEKRSARRRVGGGSSAEAAAPGAPAPGQPGPASVPDNFVPMAAIEQLKEIAQLGRPSTPGLAPPQRITSSLHASTLPELDIGSIGFADMSAPDYQSPAGIGLPSASSLGRTNGLGADLPAAKVGYGGGGVPGGTGVGGSGGGGGYGYGPGRGARGSGYGPASGTGLKSAVDRKGQAPPANKVEVKEKNLETVDLNTVFLELIEWLKSHQSELSPVLKHYLRYRPGDLTADIKIETAPVDYDLFILCNEHSQDIGILLVEQESGNAIMLRDTGFRKKSFYLSKGRASRDEVDHIVSSLTMLENSPTRAETSQFYNIFLSWWDNNKNK